MAIKTAAELMGALKDRLGESTDDATLEFLGDMQDTLADFDAKTKDQTDWKTKFEQNDARWREKYKARFFSSGDDDDSDDPGLPQDPKPLRFESLFSEGGK